MHSSLAGQTDRSTGRPKVVLLQQYLAPYRLTLFEELNVALSGGLHVLTTRDTDSRVRHWSIDHSALPFPHSRTPSFRTRIRHIPVDVPIQIPAPLRAVPELLIIDGWGTPSAFAFARYARKQGTSVAAWVETSASTINTASRAATAAREYILKKANIVIVPGSQAADFVRLIGFDGPIVVMPNTVSRAVLDTPIADVPRKGALFIGELSERKGFDLVVQSAECLKMVFGHVVVVGKGRLERSGKDSGLDMVGAVNDYAKIASLMDEAEVLLLPSRRDPWPLVAAEARTRQLPMILGHGVASAPDHIAACPGLSIQRMDQPTAAALQEAADRIAARPPSTERQVDASLDPHAIIRNLLADLSNYVPGFRRYSESGATGELPRRVEGNPL